MAPMTRNVREPMPNFPPGLFAGLNPYSNLPGTFSVSLFHSSSLREGASTGVPAPAPRGTSGVPRDAGGPGGAEPGA